jgi:exonuclease SbcC
MKQKVTEAESQINDFEIKLRNVEEEKEKIFGELLSKELLLDTIKNKKSEKSEITLDSAKETAAEITELVKQVREVEREKDGIFRQLLSKEDSLESTKKDVFKKANRIRELETQISEFSEKIKSLELERKKSLQDMAWAQNYCFGMDKRIKELESQLQKQK